ncbi:dihydrodipicolinate synthase family protein [Herbiconiux sp. L3-i23]|uniref:dihydrodipicolinate synthase family protein n=1 Tax=Herbiconiux sp. L3-i23 TaxID=2905871 RepID=UPI00204E679D|nr:dihydrodipicolinate synthase family protein [Herbiconiux sp. L3-i23]BDI22094.1 dihydrodipicolinate synthase family protein [Herbiconiux sp. L3-i23]
MTTPILIAATPTAFDADGAVDLESTRAIYAHTLEGGTHAIFVNGTTAEFAALSVAERRANLAAAVDVAGADRVIAHVGAASPHETAVLARDAVELGITRLSVLTPFYMPATLVGVRRQIAAAKTAAPQAEIYLYLFPDRTGVHVSPEQAAALIDEFDLAGAKISIAGTDYLGAVAAALSTPRTLLSGNDGLLREILAVGGHGVVSGVSSSLPEPFARLVDAIADGSDDVDSAADRVNEIVPVLGPSIAGLKLSLQLQGVITDSRCRMAIDEPASDLRERIEATIAAAAPVESSLR